MDITTLEEFTSELVKQGMLVEDRIDMFVEFFSSWFTDLLKSKITANGVIKVVEKQTL